MYGTVLQSLNLLCTKYRFSLFYKLRDFIIFSTDKKQELIYSHAAWLLLGELDVLLCFPLTAEIKPGRGVWAL